MADLPASMLAGLLRMLNSDFSELHNSIGEKAMSTAVTRAPLSTKCLLHAQLIVYQAGGTIDDLMIKTDPSFSDLDEENKKKRRNSMNVRRSQTLAKLEGEYTAKRTKLEDDLEAAGRGTDDASNDIREQIRLLNREEQALTRTFKLARKGRSGDISGVSITDMLLEAIESESADE
jgi:hypothetical protein